MTQKKLSDAMLIFGDCMQIMPTLPPHSYDLVFTDIPYGTTRAKWDSVLPLDAMWAQFKRIRKSAVILFGQSPFDKILGFSNIDELKYEWIWEKTHATGHLNAKRAPMKAHENLLVFYKKQPTYNPIMTHGHKRKTAVKRGDKTEVYGDQTIDALSYDSTSRYPRDVIKFASDKQRSGLHATQKPVDLCEYIIRTYTNPGDTVFD